MQSNGRVVHDDIGQSLFDEQMKRDRSKSAGPYSDKVAFGRTNHRNCLSKESLSKSSLQSKIYRMSGVQSPSQLNYIYTIHFVAKAFIVKKLCIYCCSFHESCNTLKFGESSGSTKTMLSLLHDYHTNAEARMQLNDRIGLMNLK